MKVEEKIVISKKNAEDLLWWIKNAPIPNNEVAWLERFGNIEQSDDENVWESLVYDLKKAIEKAEGKE